MKNGILTLSICFLLTACGSRTESGQATDTTTNTNSSSEASTAASGTAKGVQLIASSDCMSCHRDTEKLIGPAYLEVAKKYPNTPENQKMLADKIIKGGSGNWGEVPMTPHPSITESDAMEMAAYILSMK